MSRDPILVAQKGVIIYDNRGRVIGEVFSLPTSYTRKEKLSAVDSKRQKKPRRSGRRWIGNRQR